MRNPVLILTRNNLHLTRKALRTIRYQDVAGGVEIVVIDNGSTDGTVQFLNARHDLHTMLFNPQLGVAAGWNMGLRYIFRSGAEYCLVVNNDIELHPRSYRYLLNDGGGFVTLVGVRHWPASFELPPNPAKKRPHPDHSCFLIRRHVYEKVQFNESYKIAYGEDCQFHVDLHKSGLQAFCIDMPFLHHGAQTVKNTTLAEQRMINNQAEANRDFFFKKNGFRIGSEEYYQFFGTNAPPESERTL